MMRNLAVWLTVACLAAQSATGATVVVPVSEDAATIFNAGFPNSGATNYGIFFNLYAGSFDPDFLSYSRSLMKFIIPPFPVGETLESATLRLTVGQNFPQTSVFDFFRVDDNWTEGSVTWLSAPQPLPNQQPMANFDSAIGLGPAPPPRNGLSFNITSAVEAELNSDATRTLSILWKERNETGLCCNRLEAKSKDIDLVPNPDLVPQIILSFVPEPSCLGLLAPLVFVALGHRSKNRRL
jgi:hypothetical protein